MMTMSELPRDDYKKMWDEIFEETRKRTPPEPEKETPEQSPDNEPDFPGDAKKISPDAQAQIAKTSSHYQYRCSRCNSVWETVNVHAYTCPKCQSPDRVSVHVSIGAVTFVHFGTDFYWRCNYA